MVEAGIRGIAVPLTAAAVGGLIGAALWFTRPPSKAHQHRNYVRAGHRRDRPSAVMALYAALGLVDVARIPQLLQLAVHLTLAALALLALRVGLHLALLHEAHDEIRSDEPILCTECGHVVPDMAVLRGVRGGHARIVTLVAPGPTRRSDRSASTEHPTRDRRTDRDAPSRHPATPALRHLHASPSRRKTSYRRWSWCWVARIGVVAARTRRAVRAL